MTVTFQKNLVELSFENAQRKEIKKEFQFKKNLLFLFLGKESDYDRDAVGDPVPSSSSVNSSYSEPHLSAGTLKIMNMVTPSRIILN